MHVMQFNTEYTSATGNVFDFDCMGLRVYTCLPGLRVFRRVYAGLRGFTVFT